MEEDAVIDNFGPSMRDALLVVVPVPSVSFVSARASGRTYFRFRLVDCDGQSYLEETTDYVSLAAGSVVDDLNEASVQAWYPTTAIPPLVWW